MKTTRVTAFAALLAAGTIALTACGPDSQDAASAVNAARSKAANVLSSLSFTNGTAKQNNAPKDTGDFFKGPSDNPIAMKWVQLTAGAAGDLNPVVVNGAGFTLYRFDKDTASPSKSNCNGDCATTWPPVLVQPGSRIFVDGVPKSKIGVVKRDDGTLQVTIGGWPVYKFSKDTAPGQTNGQGVGGTWFGVTPDGGKAGQSPQGTDQSTGLNYLTGTAAQHNAPKNTGDFYKGQRNAPPAMKWVQLTAGSANGLNPIVHDGAGFTLYRFDKDTTSPSKSNCNGDCATTWPPVLVQPGSKIFVNGVPKSEIGVVKRDDGTLQVTIGGSPVYRFSKDTGPGQTNGEGVGGIWFAVSPVGQKVLPPVTSGTAGSTGGAAPTASASASPVTLGNGSVILDSGKNFSEPDGSVGAAGPGCQNLVQPFSALSLQLSGGPVKIWTGPDCSGTSAVVTDSVADLTAIGFTQPIASVRFGG
jgi:predicted lipoprotein with Yx(FWY)xxD motif